MTHTDSSAPKAEVTGVPALDGEAWSALPTRITSRIAVPRPDCWIWQGATDHGYGRVWIDGKAKRVHRLVWEALYGPIPEGLQLDHICRVRMCCNPAHLDLVTALENSQRAKPFRTVVKRVPLPDRSHCSQGHPLDGGNLIKQGGEWRCRECRRAASRKSVHRRRALSR